MKKHKETLISIFMGIVGGAIGLIALRLLNL